jgi:hypothetical protein
MSRFQEEYDRLDLYIDLKMKEANLVGMSVALRDREKLLRVSTYGFSVMAAQTPVTPGTLFEAGSIGKSLTSILLLMQSETGRLDLDAPVVHCLPWFQVKSKYKPITVHHLMSHTAGIIDGIDIGQITFEIPAAWKAYLGHYRSHNPWMSNFRVIFRKWDLLVVLPSGHTQKLKPISNDAFQIGEDPHSPEQPHFESFIKGHALCANYSGCPYYRTFTP